MRGFLAVLSTLALAACAFPVTNVPSAPYSSLQNEIRVETGDVLVKYLSAQKRLWHVAGPIMIANAPLCPRRSVTPGFTVLSDFDLPKQLQGVAYERALLTRDAQVQAVFGREAFDSGVRPGDVLLTMDGKSVRNSGNFRARMGARKAGTPMTYGFLRNGAAYSVTLPFVETCRYSLVYLAANREINAWTNGKTIYITQGEVDFDNDRELGVVFAHELAHNIMNHPQKQIVNSAALELLGKWADNAFGVVGLSTNFEELAYIAVSEVFQTRFEREADYVSLYLVARTGGDITAAAPYWRRNAAEHGMESVSLPFHKTRSHPDDPERFVAMEATQREIEAKTRKGEPLMPNLSRGYAFGRKYFWWDRDNNDADDEPDDAVLNH